MDGVQENRCVANHHTPPPPLLLKLLLESDRATLMDHSKYTREQELKLTDDTSYRSVWYANALEPLDNRHIITYHFTIAVMRISSKCVDCRKIRCFNPEDRLESAGSPVPVRY